MEGIKGGLFSQQELLECFPWMQRVHKEFYKTFPSDYDLDSLKLFHLKVEEEMEYISKKSHKRTRALYALLGHFYTHFRWKINWEENSPHMKDSCVKILSDLITVGLVLSGKKLTSKWLNLTLAAVEVFPGNNNLLFDALLYVNNLKKKYQDAYCIILRHVLCSKKYLMSDPVIYFKVMLLFRRLKCLMKDTYDKHKTICLAASIKAPPNTISWLIARNFEDLLSVQFKLLGKQIMSNRLNPSILHRLRMIILPEVKAFTLKNSHAPNSFVTDPQGLCVKKIKSRQVVNNNEPWPTLTPTHLNKKKQMLKQCDITQIDKNKRKRSDSSLEQNPLKIATEQFTNPIQKKKKNLSKKLKQDPERNAPQNPELILISSDSERINTPSETILAAKTALKNNTIKKKKRDKKIKTGREASNISHAAYMDISKPDSSNSAEFSNSCNLQSTVPEKLTKRQRKKIKLNTLFKRNKKANIMQSECISESMPDGFKSIPDDFLYISYTKAKDKLQCSEAVENYLQPDPVSGNELESDSYEKEDSNSLFFVDKMPSSGRFSLPKRSKKANSKNLNLKRITPIRIDEFKDHLRTKPVKEVVSQSSLDSEIISDMKEFCQEYQITPIEQLKQENKTVLEKTPKRITPTRIYGCKDTLATNPVRKIVSESSYNSEVNSDLKEYQISSPQVTSPGQLNKAKETKSEMNPKRITPIRVYGFNDLVTTKPVTEIVSETSHDSEVISGLEEMSMEYQTRLSHVRPTEQLKQANETELEKTPKQITPIRIYGCIDPVTTTHVREIVSQSYVSEDILDSKETCKEYQIGSSQVTPCQLNEAKETKSKKNPKRITPIRVYDCKDPVATHTTKPVAEIVSESSHSSDDILEMNETCKEYQITCTEPIVPKSINSDISFTVNDNRPVVAQSNDVKVNVEQKGLVKAISNKPVPQKIQSMDTDSHNPLLSPEFALQQDEKTIHSDIDIAWKHDYLENEVANAKESVNFPCKETKPNCQSSENSESKSDLSNVEVMPEFEQKQAIRKSTDTTKVSDVVINVADMDLSFSDVTPIYSEYSLTEEGLKEKVDLTKDFSIMKCASDSSTVGNTQNTCTESTDSLCIGNEQQILQASFTSDTSEKNPHESFEESNEAIIIENLKVNIQIISLNDTSSSHNTQNEESEQPVVENVGNLQTEYNDKGVKRTNLISEKTTDPNAMNDNCSMTDLNLHNLSPCHTTDSLTTSSGNFVEVNIAGNKLLESKNVLCESGLSQINVISILNKIDTGTEVLKNIVSNYIAKKCSIVSTDHSTQNARVEESDTKLNGTELKASNSRNTAFEDAEVNDSSRTLAESECTVLCKAVLLPKNKDPLSSIPCNNKQEEGNVEQMSAEFEDVSSKEIKQENRGILMNDSNEVNQKLEVEDLCKLTSPLLATISSTTQHCPCKDTLLTSQETILKENFDLKTDSPNTVKNNSNGGCEEINECTESSVVANTSCEATVKNLPVETSKELDVEKSACGILRHKAINDIMETMLKRVEIVDLAVTGRSFDNLKHPILKPGVEMTLEKSTVSIVSKMYKELSGEESPELLREGEQYLSFSDISLVNKESIIEENSTQDNSIAKTPEFSFYREHTNDANDNKSESTLVEVAHSDQMEESMCASDVSSEDDCEEDIVDGGADSSCDSPRFDNLEKCENSEIDIHPTEETQNLSENVCSPDVAKKLVQNMSTVIVSVGKRCDEKDFDFNQELNSPLTCIPDLRKKLDVVGAEEKDRENVAFDSGDAANDARLKYEFEECSTEVDINQDLEQNENKDILKPDNQMTSADIGSTSTVPHTKLDMKEVCLDEPKKYSLRRKNPISEHSTKISADVEECDDEVLSSPVRKLRRTSVQSTFLDKSKAGLKEESVVTSHTPTKPAYRMSLRKTASTRKELHYNEEFLASASSTVHALRRFSKRQKKSVGSNLGFDFNQLSLNSPKQKGSRSNSPLINNNLMGKEDVTSSAESEASKPVGSKRRVTRSSTSIVVKQEESQLDASVESYNLRSRRSIILPGKLKVLSVKKM